MIAESLSTAPSQAPGDSPQTIHVKSSEIQVGDVCWRAQGPPVTGRGASPFRHAIHPGTGYPKTSKSSGKASYFRRYKRPGGNMGLRLSFGVGPLRASVPLTSRRRRRSSRPAQQGWQGTGEAYTPDQRHVRFQCGHHHRSQSAALECVAKRRAQIEHGNNLHLVTKVLDTPESRQRAAERAEQKARRQEERAAQRQEAARQRAERRASAPAGQAFPLAESAQVSSGPPRIENTVMTGYPSPGWQPPPAQPRKSWPARHKAWTAVLGILGIFVVLGVIGAIAGPPKPKLTASAGAIPASTSSSPTPTPTTSPPAAPLTTTASVTGRHPRTGGKVGVSVVTAPHARITVIAHFEAGDREKTARADSTGSHTFWFPVGSAPPGVRVTVVVRVSAHGQKRSSRVWFTPRQPPPPPAPKATTAPAPPTGCYPKTDGGNCYEPGEFCRTSDQGMRGVAEDGEAIICENNDGLRWEPA